MIYDPKLSHFDIDVERGTQGELFLLDILRMLKERKGEIEVKRDAYFVSGHAARNKQQRFYVEQECWHQDGIYHPSGLRITKAKFWAFALGAHPGIFVVSTEWLRRATALAEQNPRNAGSCDYGDNPTRGIYVYMNHFLMTRELSLDEH